MTHLLAHGARPPPLQHPALAINGTEAPFLKPAPCVELLEKDTKVMYTPRGEKEGKGVTILAVHGDCFPPYYTIDLGDGKQRQVVPREFSVFSVKEWTKAPHTAWKRAP